MENQEKQVIEIKGTGIRLDDIVVCEDPRIESYDFSTYMNINSSMIKIGFDFETNPDIKLELDQKVSPVSLRYQDKTTCIIRPISKKLVFLNDQLHERQGKFVNEFIEAINDLEHALTKEDMLGSIESNLKSEGEPRIIIDDTRIAINQMKGEIGVGREKESTSEGSKVISRIQERVNRAYEEERMGGATYGIVTYFDEKDTEQKHPKTKYIISNPAAQLVEERTIWKRITDTKSVPIGVYYYLEGIDGILVKRTLKELNNLRVEINQSNEDLYTRIQALKEKEEIFERNKKTPIAGLRYTLYKKSMNSKRFRGNKNRWFLKWYYNAFRDIRETDMDIKRSARTLERRMVGLNGTDNGLIESDNPEFCMDKTVFKKYRRLTEQPPKTEGTEEILENKTSEYLPESVVEKFFNYQDEKRNNAVFATVFSDYGAKFKDNLELLISGFKEIVAFHLGKKGLKIDKDEKPEKLIFYDTIEGRNLEDSEEPKNPIDYIVGKNGKTVLLLCVDYSGLVCKADTGEPIKKNEVPNTVFREMEHTQQTPKRERKIARKIVYSLAAAAGLLLIGNIAQGYMHIKSSPSKQGQSITLIDGLQKTIGDFTQSFKSVTGEEKTSLTEKIAEKDNTIAQKDSTIDMLAQVATNQALGISDTSKEEMNKKLEEMLINYNPENVVMIQSWKSIKGITPTAEQILNVYTKTGNIDMIRDTAIYQGRIDSAMAYKTYTDLVYKGDFAKANKLNIEFGPIEIQTTDKAKFIKMYPRESRFWELVGANHDFTDLENYESFQVWAEYSKDYKIKSFKKTNIK